ncbi:transcriptional regulator [Hydrotalea sp. AMD]|uniref:transcriptional regulator n=1 Tax=Hydrotalea TaxID=1004300 RepID=UPI00338F9508
MNLKIKRSRLCRSRKKFSNNYPLTICKITPKGIEAFEAYVKVLQEYLNAGKK